MLVVQKKKVSQERLCLINLYVTIFSNCGSIIFSYNFLAFLSSFEITFTLHQNCHVIFKNANFFQQFSN